MCAFVQMCLCNYLWVHIGLDIALVYLGRLLVDQLRAGSVAYMLHAGLKCSCSRVCILGLMYRRQTERKWMTTSSHSRLASLSLVMGSQGLDGLTTNDLQESIARTEYVKS